MFKKQKLLKESDKRAWTAYASIERYCGKEYLYVENIETETYLLLRPKNRQQ